MSDLFNKLLILRSPGIGPARYNALVRKFGDVSAVVESLTSDQKLRDSVLREMDLAQSLGVHYICDDSDVYPSELKKVKNHPPVLTVRGNLGALSGSVVSVVGTRNATAAGMRFTENLSRIFVEHGYKIASGLAMGTDAAAHRGALQADGDSNTIAIVAGGVDYIWPTENESLYWEIVARGAIVSEMPVGFVPLATNFVQRNRWVAGICEKLILGEADESSGSMTTARFAIEYGRQIYAIPSHPADLRSVGPNSLIRDGLAKLCMGPGDFFQENKKITKKEDLSDSILEALGTNSVSESVLAEIVKKSISEIKRDLVVLELRGLIKKVDNGYIRI